MNFCWYLFAFLLSTSFSTYTSSIDCSLSQGALIHFADDGQQLLLTTVYGTTTIQEPVLIELIKCPQFQRLKKVHQYGVMRYSRPNEPKYTRYQHSLGVFFLTRLYGASLEEQIVALLHDISHTAFSHVAERLFSSDYFISGNSYQDTIHEKYITNSGIILILRQYGLEHICSLEIKETYRLLEQKLPYLCTDRIDYNLIGGQIDGLLTKEQVADIISHLHFKNGNWFFDSVAHAKQFGLISIQLSQTRWGTAWCCLIDTCAAQALKRAVQLNIITYDDIHFSTDAVIWKKLLNSSDEHIARYIHHIQNPTTAFSIGTPEQSTLHLVGKFSGTDPFVLVHGVLTHLTEIDPHYKQLFWQAKTAIATGSHIVF